jgi:5-methylcytosine-specific restriction endonuclease McrA
MELTKKCSVCGETKIATTEFFYKHRKALHAKCKICYKIYQTNKSKTPEYRAKRKARLLSQNEYIRERQRKYWAKNAEKLRAYHSAYDRARPDKALARVHKRRARKLNNGVENYTKKDVLDRYGINCMICYSPINLDVSGKPGAFEWELGLHIDHIIPISKGGPDSLDNVRPTHGKCNLTRLL